jgi:putative transposase
MLLLYLCNSTNKVDLGDLLRQGLALSEIFEIDRGETLVSIGAWALMPNHFHILVKEENEVGIAMFIQKLLTSYSMYFNYKYKRKGTLYSGPFKAEHLDYDQYLKYILTYIHLNPIGIIDKGWKEKKLTDENKARHFLNMYKYSSYSDYCGEVRPQGRVLNKKAFPEYFESVLDFKDMIMEWMDFGQGEALSENL